MGLITRRSEVQILPPPRQSGSSDPDGVLGSSDDDRAQHAPVRPGGVEQGPDPVVLEVPEPTRSIRLLSASMGPLLILTRWKLQILSNHARMVRPSFWTSGDMARLAQ